MRDCAVIIPRLKAITDKLGNKPRITIRGKIKVDRINKKFMGLEELEELRITKVPITILFNKYGSEIERIIEQPEDVLERTLVKILS